MVSINLKLLIIWMKFFQQVMVKFMKFLNPFRLQTILWASLGIKYVREVAKVSQHFLLLISFFLHFYHV